MSQDHTPTARTDEELLRQSITHPALFEELIGRYQSALMRKARKILRNEQDAEDAVQDTFTKIYVNASRFEKVDGASFKSWAYTILINTCLSLYKREKLRSGKTVELDPDLYEQLPDTQVDEYAELESADYLRSVMNRMPLQLRRILELYFINGEPQQEIARLEGITVGAVKTRMYRAKREFKKLASL